MLFPSKITIEKIGLARSEASRRHPGKGLVVLLDQDLPMEEIEFVDCRRASIEEFKRRDFPHTVYIYGCDSEDIGWRFVEVIIARGGTFLPVFESTPSLYVHINDTARRVLEEEYSDQIAAGFAKWDYGPHDFVNLLQAIDLTAILEGDFVEIGCYRGSSGCVALRYMKEIALRRKCLFFDVFEGFNYPQALTSADAYWRDSHATEGMPEVEARLRKYESPETGPTVSVFKSNIIEDALPPELGRICVANIDVDMYEAVLASLNKVAPRMVHNGIVIVEDPGHAPLLIGARVALNQFMMTRAAAGFLPIYMQSGQTLLFNSGLTGIEKR